MKNALLFLALTSFQVSVALGVRAEEPFEIPSFTEEGAPALRADLSAWLRKVPAPDASLVDIMADEGGGVWLFGKIPGQTLTVSFCRPTVPLHCTAWVEFGRGSAIPKRTGKSSTNTP